MLQDTEIARLYLNKYKRAVAAGYDFDLSFTSYKNMMRAKHCYYTGIGLTQPRSGNYAPRTTDRTIDRIDNTIGYVKGNVVACSHAANQFKSTFESGQSVFQIKHIKRMMRKL